MVVKWLIFLFPLVIYCQKEVDTMYITVGDTITYNFEYSKSLETDICTFISKCNKNEINLSFIKSLKGVYLTSDMEELTGLYAYGVTLENKELNTMILIDDTFDFLPTFIRGVLYHEMYHVKSKKQHGEYLNYPYLLNSGLDIDIETVIKNWDQMEEEYFEYIKNN